MRMASLKDVAKLASVSLMTVSRAINHPETLAPATYQRVKQAIEKLNYVPDLSARKIRYSKNLRPSLGVLAFDTATTPFSVELLLAIEKTAATYGWTTFFVNLFQDNNSNDTVNLLLSQRPNGIIFTTMGLRKINIPTKLINKPMVLANCVTDDLAVASYIPDDFNGQFLATKKLIEYGYRHPLCLYLSEKTLAGIARRRGFEQAWLAAGYQLHKALQYHIGVNDIDYFSIIHLIEQHISAQSIEFDVLVCGNDRIAFLAYQVLLAKQIRIPEDVAILGYDNMVGVGQLFWPPLTTVQLPHKEIGEQAVRHIIEKREHTHCCKIDSPLLERASLLKH